jgi:hypothetical protein
MQEVFIFYSCGGLRPSPLGTPATIRAIAAATDEDDDVDVDRSTVCGEAGVIRIARESTTRRKPVPVPLRLSKIPNYST